MSADHNSEYWEDTLAGEISSESQTFKSVFQGLVDDTCEEFPTNTVWLGTVIKDGKRAQIQLTVTSEPSKFIDED